MMKSLKPLSKQAVALRAGVYEHYRGERYRLVGVARHSETFEELVVYQALYGDRTTWVSPLVRFCEVVEYNGHIMPRFRYIG